MPFYFLLSALWVVVDQVVKYLVRTYIPLYASVPFLPGMDLTYVQNTGAAFSLLSEHTWVLTLLSAVVSVGLVVAMAKRILPHWSGMLSLALLLGDPVYGGVRKGFPELAGQCLHARRLTFRHPRTGESITLSCPLPDYFQAVLTRCARLV